MAIKNKYTNKYLEYYKQIEDKYSALIEENSKVILNWHAKIAPKNSLTESEGRCGGGPTRSPKYVKFKSFERNWNGITLYYDKHITLDDLSYASSPVNVAVLMEPRHFRPEFYNSLIAHHDKFQMILTHNSDILDEYPGRAIYCIAGAPIIENSSIGINSKNKNRLVSKCYSNKGFLKGHKFRHDAVKAIKQFNGIPEVDLYGSGSPSGPVKLKSDTLINHMFSIVVENGVTDAYFTEKIMDCFLTGNIPIYRGASKIGDFFDKRGIIEFNTIEELEFILKNKINKKTYKRMLPYARNNLEITKRYMYIDDIMLFSILDRLEKEGHSFEYLKNINFGAKKHRI